MCCFCQEGTALELACQLSESADLCSDLEEKPAFSEALLMESEHLVSTFSRYNEDITNIIHQIKESGFDEDEVGYWSISRLGVAFCRIIETFVKYGFKSEKYQTLLKMPLVADIIETYNLLPPPENNLLFASDSSFSSIFRSNFMLSNHYSDKLPKIEDCIILLTRYVEIWHYRSENDEDSPLIDCSYISTYVPIIMYCFTMIEVNNPGDEIFSRIINKTNHMFGGSLVSLWLQRKAAILVYESRGISAFMPYREKVRPSLIYYLTAKRILDNDSKKAIQDAIIKSGKYDPDRKIKFARERNLIYEEPEIFIMERL